MVDDLYQETILDHSKRPRNCHPMPDANRKAEGYNPLCGDELTFAPYTAPLSEPAQIRRFEAWSPDLP